MTKYTKITNVYNDGFNDVCSCCNEPYPTYKVKLEGEKYNVHLNNKQFVRFLMIQNLKRFNLKLLKILN